MALATPFAPQQFTDVKQRKHLAILGSTGSIGTQTLDVVSEYPDHLYPSVLTAHSNVALLIQQARRFKPRKVVIARDDLYSTLKEALAGEPIEVACGAKAIAEAAAAPDIDMVVTVKEAESSPYYNCFEEGDDGFLQISKGDGTFTRRQDAPKAWEYNGAVYVINTTSLRQMPLGKFKRRRMCPMDAARSIDLDTPLDWLIAAHLMKERNIQASL